MPTQVNENRMIDVKTATAEEIEALPKFIKTKMFSSDEWQGRAKHAQNMRGPGSIARPARVEAELAADEAYAAGKDADTEIVPDEPAS